MTSESECLPPARWSFRSQFLQGVRFDLRPISQAPADDRTVGFLYRRDGDNYRQSGVGLFKDGRWHDSKRQPIDGDYLWAVMVDER